MTDNTETKKFSWLASTKCFCFGSIGVFFLLLCVLAVKSMSIPSSIEVKVIDKVGKSLDSFDMAISSLHGISADLRKNFTNNEIRLTAIQEKTFGALDLMTKSLAKSVDTLNSKFDKLASSADELVGDARALVKTTDLAVGKISNDLSESIVQLRGMVAVVVNNQLAGFLEAGTSDLKIIGNRLNQLFDDSHIVLSEVGTNFDRIGKNVEDITFYVANITKSGQEVADYYKKTLIHPSGWQRFKQVMNVVLYGAGQILIPWLVTKKVEVVN